MIWADLELVLLDLFPRATWYFLCFFFDLSGTYGANRFCSFAFHHSPFPLSCFDAGIAVWAAGQSIASQPSDGGFSRLGACNLLII